MHVEQGDKLFSTQIRRGVRILFTAFLNKKKKNIILNCIYEKIKFYVVESISTMSAISKRRSIILFPADFKPIFKLQSSVLI